MISDFGEGVSPVLPQNLQCNGNEVALHECSSRMINPNQCQKVAGITCEGEHVVQMLHLYLVYTYIVNLSTIIILVTSMLLRSK